MTLTANGGPVTAPVTTSATASISSLGSLGTKFLRLNFPRKLEPSAALLSNNNFSSSVIKSLLPSAIFLLYYSFFIHKEGPRVGSANNKDIGLNTFFYLCR